MYLTQVPITLQKSRHIRPALHPINQLLQSWVILKPRAPILRKILIMADLIDDQVGIRNVLPNNKRPLSRQIIRLQMRLQRTKEAVAIALLVFRIRLVLVITEESHDEQCSPYPFPNKPSISLRSHRTSPHSKEGVCNVQSIAISHIASAQYISSSVVPSYWPNSLAKCLRIA